MVGLSLNDLWSSGVRRFLKPEGLVRGFIAVYRAIVGCLDDIPYISDSKPPASHGKLSELVTVPLSSVQYYGAVAGIDNLVSGQTLEPNAEFPYMISGLDEGIISFSKGVDGVTAYLYSDFVFRSGVYYFRGDPTQYGVVSTSSSVPEISFVTANYKKTTTAFQDTSARFYGSGEYKTNVDLSCKDALAGILCAPGKLALESCGIRTSLNPATLKKAWTEGGVVCALTEGGELLLDPIASELPGTDNLAGGEPLSKEVMTYCRIYPYGDKLYCITDTESDVVVDDCYLDEVLPAFSGSVLSADVAGALIEKSGYITLVRLSDYPEYKTQTAIETRTNKLNTQYLVNFIDVTTTLPENSEYNLVYVYYTTDRRKSVQPLVYSGISPRSALFGNFPEFGVLRIPVQDFTTHLMALTDNGEVYNRKLRCGDIIKAVSFVYNDTSEQKAENDVIVYHMQIPEVTVGAGGSAVLRFR